MEGKASVPENSPLGRVLASWSTYAYKPMTKKKIVFYCNTVWLMYNLDSRECWLLNGSLNHYIILQLELFCQRSGKWDGMLYMEAFMSLHNKDTGLKEN